MEELQETSILTQRWQIVSSLEEQSNTGQIFDSYRNDQTENFRLTVQQVWFLLSKLTANHQYKNFMTKKNYNQVRKTFGLDSWANILPNHILFSSRSSF